MRKEMIRVVRRSVFNKRVLIIGLFTVSSIGVLGAVDYSMGGHVFNDVAEKTGLIRKMPAVETIQPQTATPQISKEYIHAGSRTVAVEDYGISSANPTPTP